MACLYLGPSSYCSLLAKNVLPDECPCLEFRGEPKESEEILDAGEVVER